MAEESFGSGLSEVDRTDDFVARDKDLCMASNEGSDMDYGEMDAEYRGEDTDYEGRNIDASKRLQSVQSYGSQSAEAWQGRLATSASDLRMQIMEERDTFLYEYDQLEQELFEMRQSMAKMQRQLEDANRRWEYERTMKLQLEQQLMYSPQCNLSLNILEPNDQACISSADQEPESSPDTEDRLTNEAMCSDGDQPETPAGKEDFEGRERRRNPSTTGSSLQDESPGTGREPAGNSIGPQNEAEGSLALAFEAQVALAHLRQEQRHIIDELVEAKLEVAALKSQQGAVKSQQGALKSQRKTKPISTSPLDSGFTETHIIARSPTNTPTVKKDKKRSWFRSK